MFSRVKFKAVIIDKKSTLFCTRVMYFGQQQTNKTQKIQKVRVIYSKINTS